GKEIRLDIWNAVVEHNPAAGSFTGSAGIPLVAIVFVPEGVVTGAVTCCTGTGDYVSSNNLRRVTIGVVVFYKRLDILAVCHFLFNKIKLWVTAIAFVSGFGVVITFGEVDDVFC